MTVGQVSMSWCAEKTRGFRRSRSGGWADGDPIVTKLQPTVVAWGPVRCAKHGGVDDRGAAGTAYYAARRVAGDLRPSEAFVLCRESANAYDELAVEVFTGAGAKLGYVPRADIEPFARLMDACKQVEAEVVDVTHGRWRDIAMTLKLHIA